MLMKVIWVIISPFSWITEITFKMWNIWSMLCRSVVGICKCVQLPGDSRAIKSFWIWYYRMCWVAQFGFWELNSDLLNGPLKKPPHMWLTAIFNSRTRKWDSPFCPQPKTWTHNRNTYTFTDLNNRLNELLKLIWFPYVCMCVFHSYFLYFFH